MLASSRKPCHTANPRRRAKSPTLHCGRDRAATDERLLSVKHAGGPMRSSAPAQRRAAACHPRRCCTPALYCRAGVHARRKGLRRPGRILAGQGRAGRRTPPSAPCGASTSPYRGGFAARLPCIAGRGHHARRGGLHRRSPCRLAQALPIPPYDTAMQGGREQAARNRQPSARSGALPAVFSLPGPFRILPACPAPL